MRLRHFVPHDENGDIQVNQKDMDPNADAVESADIFDENLPVTQGDTSGENPEEETTPINHQTESSTVSEVYAPEIIARRTSIKRDNAFGRHRQTLTRTQHPLMEIDENHDQRVPCTLVPEEDQNYGRDNPAVSHNNTREMANTKAQTDNTTGTSSSTETRYYLRANPTPKKYTDFLIHQISDASAALRPEVTQRDGTRTHSSQQQTSSESILDSVETADDQNNSQPESSKNKLPQTNTSQKKTL